MSKLFAYFTQSNLDKSKLEIVAYMYGHMYKHYNLHPHIRIDFYVRPKTNMSQLTHWVIKLNVHLQLTRNSKAGNTSQAFVIHSSAAELIAKLKIPYLIVIYNLQRNF